jgi:hypothetical protein
MFATFTSTPVFEIAFCQKALGYPLHKPQAFFFIYLAGTGYPLHKPQAISFVCIL